MPEQQVSGSEAFLGLVYMLGVIALWAWLGYAAGSAWVGLIGFVSLIMVQVALSRAATDKFSGVAVLEWLGFWGIWAAGTMAEYAGRWLWIIPWAAIGLMLIVTGAASAGKASWASWSGYAFGIWSLAWAAIGPIWLYDKNQQETDAFFRRLLADRWWVLIIAFTVLMLFVVLVSFAQERRKLRRRARLRLHEPSPPTAGRTGLGQNPIFGLQPPARRSGRAPAQPPGPPAQPPAPPARPPEPGRPQPTVLAEGLLASDGDFAVPGPHAEAGATVLGTSGPVPGAAPTVLPGQPAAGELLYTVRAHVVDFAASDGDHFLLTDRGHLLRHHGDTTAEVPGVALDQPLGLSAAGDVLVAAGTAAQFVSVQAHNGGPPDVHLYETREELACFTLNPYGTIVAYAPARGGVHAIMLATGERQLLTEDEVTTAMAFSADGRVLGLGGHDGSVRQFDMATRQVQDSFAPPQGEHDSVVALVAEPSGGWVAGYASGRVACWDASGTSARAVMEPHHVLSLAVEQGSGRVAVACDGGYVIIHPAALGPEVFGQALGSDRIVRAVFGQNGRELVTAGREGSVRRIQV